MTFNRLVNEYLDHVSGCDDCEDNFDATYMADLKARKVFRKVIIRVNDRYSEVIELSDVENDPESFNKRVIWHSDFNGIENDTNITLDRKFLEKELKEIESRVRHYGNRVLENI